MFRVVDLNFDFRLLTGKGISIQEKMEKIYRTLRGMKILAMLLFVCQNYVVGQSFDWAKREGAFAYDYGYGSTTDIYGNVYVSGKFEQNGIFSGDTLPCYGNHDIYVAKY